MSALAGIINTEFYPSSLTPPGINISTGNARNPTAPQAYAGAVGENGSLPALWWLGILIVLIALRLVYEYL